MERTEGECFGCPAYKVFINTDGKIIFVGIKNVEKKGVFEGKINNFQLQELIKEFENINYLQLSDKYIRGENCPNTFSDSPYARTFFSTKNDTKSIFHHLGCEGSEDLEKLKAIEDKIDNVSNTKQWVK
ncbi:MAG: hypothetical protein H0W45_01680 [Acidobacteria bacterium]|nr:hypothetical protein [Acidobacteriota bacterium]